MTKKKEKKVTKSKITVIGDSWRQLLILPEKTTASSKRKSQQIVTNIGASRLCELIRAATKNKIALNSQYIPKSGADTQVCVTFLLKECDKDNDFFKDLSDAGIEMPKKLLRIDNFQGVSPFRRAFVDEPSNQDNKPLDEKLKDTQYLVIYDDCFYTRELSDYQDQQKELYEGLMRVLFKEEYPKRILWYPRRFGDNSLKRDDNGFCLIIDGTLIARNLLANTKDPTDRDFNARNLLANTKDPTDRDFNGLIKVIEKDNKIGELIVKIKGGEVWKKLIEEIGKGNVLKDLLEEIKKGDNEIKTLIAKIEKGGALKDLFEKIKKDDNEIKTLIAKIEKGRRTNKQPKEDDALKKLTEKLKDAVVENGKERKELRKKIEEGKAFKDLVTQIRETEKFKEKITKIKDKMIVFLRADDLADAGMGQRGDGSVEECLEGILDGMQGSLREKELLRDCEAVVIENNVDSAFLLHLATNDKDNHCQTFFRTYRTDSAYRQDGGHIRGRGDFMVASCLKALINNGNKNIKLFKCLTGGIRDGLLRMLINFNVGYLTDGKGNDNTAGIIYKDFKDSEIPQKYLVRAVDDKGIGMDDVQKKPHKYPATYLSRGFRFPKQPLDFLPPGLLENQWANTPKEYKFIFLKNIVEKGLENLVRKEKKELAQEEKINFPVARLGKMDVVDPDEISMFRRLSNLIRQHFDNKTPKPLGLAIFGAPGSGKSFTVERIVEEAVGKEKYHLTVCNLAQFKDPDNLYRKFLEARNYSIENREDKRLLSVIVLDEFDAEFDKVSFGWCKYLLSVLEDGTIRIGGDLYDIGNALVICAGGVCQSFREFEWKSQKKKEAKVPDLISRFRGYADIAGPNPYFPYPWNETTKQIFEDLDIRKSQPSLEPAWIMFKGLLDRIVKQDPMQTASSLQELGLSHDDRAILDPLFEIRRAVLLRSYLITRMPSIYNEEEKTIAIESKVLRAFLKIPEYKYGGRSMQAIIDMSVLISPDSSRRFTAAMLPPPEQLDMHVDAAEFYDIIAKSDLMAEQEEEA